MQQPKSDLDGKVTTNLEEKLSKKAREAKSSAIRELLDLIKKPGVISLAGGIPDPKTLPLKATDKSTSHFKEKGQTDSLQYCCTEGIAPLRKYLSNYMCRYGIEAEPENILPTTGSQQALFLLALTFLESGSNLVTSAPTYTGAIQAFDFQNANFLTVDLDQEGMRVDQIPPLLENRKAKFIYVLPNFHNPGGVSLSKERRYQLAEIAADNGLYIVEDDPYGELRYEGKNITPILPLHKENVIYMSTFSKTLAPGLRLGWVTAPKKIIKKMVKIKQGLDLCSPALNQYIVHYMCTKESFLKDRLKELRDIYQQKRDVMLKAMEKNFPEGVDWSEPQGGLFLWVSLSEGADSKELFEIALRDYKVAFVHGSAFYPNKNQSNDLRLNFSLMPEKKIKKGIERLGDAIRAYRDQQN